MPAAKKPAITSTRKASAPRAAHTADKGRTTLVDRAGERAIETTDRLATFAKNHPVAIVVGGLAIGVLVSGLFKGSPTRKLGKQAKGLASVGAELAVAYAAQALAASEPARKEAVEKLSELGDAALKYGKSGSDAALKYGKSGSEAALKYGRSGSDAIEDVARSAGKRLAKALSERFN